MKYSHRAEEARIFYGLIGKSILNIESRSIPESEKKEQYEVVDRSIKIYESFLEISLRFDAECGRLYERLGDVASSLERIGEGLDEFERDAKNLELFIEVFGIEPWNFSGN